MPIKAVMQGSKVFVCATVQNSDLANAAAYAALTWVQVGSVGSIGEFGATSSDLTYNTLDETVTTHQKGIADAGSPQIEVVDLSADPGQVILRTFGSPTNKGNMAVKFERADGGTTNTILYSRGVVTGPTYPNGGSEDFDLARFTIMLNQLPIRVEAT